MRIRVHALAKELGLTSKALLAVCRDLGIEVRTHSSSLEEAAVARIRAKVPGASAASPSPDVPQAPTPPVPVAPSAASETGRQAPPPQPVPSKARASTPVAPTAAPPRKKKSLMRKMLRSMEQEKKRREGVKEPSSYVVHMPVTARELSGVIGIKVSDILAYLMRQKIIVNQNAPLDEEMVLMVCSDFHKEVVLKQTVDKQDALTQEIEQQEPDDAALEPRDPCVAFLGHVDHGKTSLLDHIRKANVQAAEAGGITQHIGAYRAQTNNGYIVFLDTPGHQAFTEMRARGANITDIVVLVVAADDGIMPQTEEAISHARNAKVPIVVAMNKIDKPEANVNMVKQQLSSCGLQPEDWGGSTVCVEVSATTGQGIDELLEMIRLEADMLELKCAPSRKAAGTVLEARLKEGQGPVVNVLVQDGTLKRGAIVICGRTYGKVRAIIDEHGRHLKEARPSMPIQMLGLNDVPDAGDRFFEVTDLKKAKSLAEQRSATSREQSLHTRQQITLDNLFSQMDKQEEQNTLNIILKADVKGSLEVLKRSVSDLSNDDIVVRILHAAVGGINESDVLLAEAAGAIIVGFHVTPDGRARKSAENRHIDIRIYQVIYELLDDVSSAMQGLLSPTSKEVAMGQVEVREVFKISKVGNIAGCYVRSGRVVRNAKARLIRDGVIIYDGKLDSLKRFKESIREVKEGFECGLHIAGYDDIKVGDTLEIYKIEEVSRTFA